MDDDGEKVITVDVRGCAACGKNHKLRCVKEGGHWMGRCQGQVVEVIGDFRVKKDEVEA